MANPTSNFGWQMPTNTDLVKDLPADFETFGQAVDSDLADLKGGTTGQVLSKNSDTDMDFAWVTSDDANAIQNAIVDAKGDLISATAADTPARLAVGNNGETIVADSAATTGLRWQPSVTAGKNLIINGAMDIWQRGTSITASGAYTADRWAQVSGVSATFSRSTDVPSNSGFTYSMSMAGVGPNINQRIESLQAAAVAGQTITVSFWYKSTVGTDVLNFQIWYANTADNFAGLTQIGSTQTINTPSTSWTRVSYTFTNISANAINGLSIYIYRGNNATSTTLVTGVQMELGSVATAFSRAAGTLQGELAACQRYFWRNDALSNSYSQMAMAYGYSTTAIQTIVQFPVTMRVKPSSIGYSNLGYADIATGGGGTISTISINQGSPSTAQILITGLSSITNYRQYTVQANNSTSGYLEFSAEL